MNIDGFTGRRFYLQKGTYLPRDHKKIEMITLGG